MSKAPVRIYDWSDVPVSHAVWDLYWKEMVPVLEVAAAGGDAAAAKRHAVAELLATGVTRADIDAIETFWDELLEEGRRAAARAPTIH